jgi:precorrin-2 dehydrogenase/sirohydrochlorin ferrochelatase
VCLVVGGGRVGERKIRRLLEYGASIRIAARTLTQWLEFQRGAGTVVLVGEDYDGALLEGVHLVFAATSDPALNRRVSLDAEARGIWCNMATDPELGSFIAPALFRRGPLSIAIGTQGLSPALAVKIREDMEARYGPEWEALLDFLGLLRKAVQTRQLGADEDHRIFKEVAELPLAQWMRAGAREAAVAAIHSACGAAVSREELARFWDETWKAFFSFSQPSVTSLE